MKNIFEHPKVQGFLLIALGLLILFGIVFGIASYYAKDADLEGEQISHTQCQVYEKDSRKTTRGRAHEPNYYIYSSCGEFQTSEEIYNGLEVEEYYDWFATAGSWANKPTITETPIPSYY